MAEAGNRCDDPPRDYRKVSYWLESAGDDLTPRPSLAGASEVDVAILGAGFTGLWTAYYLLRREPSLRVAVLERHIAGFGASGRNGAWCTGGFPVSLDALDRRYGAEQARAVFRAMADTVDEVGRVAEAEGIDAQFRKGGELLVARGSHQLPAIEREFATLERLGLDAGSAILTGTELEKRLAVSKAVAALYTPACATIHPGKLVRGLARTVERMGGVIYEQSEVITFTGGSPPHLTTEHGMLRAQSLVLAGEAYLTRLPELHRVAMPIYSLIVLTEPLTSAQWERVGWEGNECVASARYTIDYLTRTTDGRILFGGRGAPYHFGSRIEDRFDRHRPTHATLRRQLVNWFPSLKGIRFTHAWGGPLAVARDWMPTMSYDPRTNIAMAHGYTGQGVATSNLSGRVLTDLLTGTTSALTALPTVGHRSRRWEPEPLRWLGQRFVQRGLRRLDEKAERTGKAPTGHTLAERLAGH